MAVRYNNHEVNIEDLVDFEPEVLLASGRNCDGIWKRLYIQHEFSPELSTFIIIECEGKQNVEFSSIVDAMNAYNEL